MSKVIGILSATCISILVYIMVSIANIPTDVVEMDLHQVGCDIDGKNEVFFIPIPRGADEERYGREYCETLALDMLISSSEEMMGENDIDYK